MSAHDIQTPQASEGTSRGVPLGVPRNVPRNVPGGALGRAPRAASGGAAPRPKRWRWARRLAFGAAAATGLFAVLGFFVVPPVAKHVAQTQLGELLGRKVSIGRVRVNPFSLTVTVEDFQVFEADQTTPFVGFRRLYINGELSSVWRRAPVIREVSLDAPHMRIVREKATPDAYADLGMAYNFSDILARLAARPQKPEPAGPPPRFSLNNVRLTGGALTFDDRPVGAHHEVTELSIGVPFASTLPVYVDSFVEPGLSLRVDGTPFSVAGRTKPFKDSRETVLELRLSSLDLTRYVPFVPLVLPFTVDSARLSLTLDVKFVHREAAAPTLTLKGSVGLDKVDLREKRKTGSAPLAKLEHFEVDLGESEVIAQNFHVDKVLLTGLDLHVRRQHDGSLNLEHLAPQAGGVAGTGAASGASPSPPAKGMSGGKGNKAEAGAEGPRFLLDLFTLENGVVHFRDETVRPVFESEVKDVTASVRGLSNAPGATAKMTATLHANPGGTVTQRGTLRLTPFAATGTIAVEGIEPGRFSPYYRDEIAFEVAKGRLRLGAGYEVAQDHARTTIRLSDAHLDLSDLVLHRRPAREDFLRLGALSVRGGRIDVDAQTVSIGEITTRDGHLRIARDEQGVVDLTTLVGPPPPVPAPVERPRRGKGGAVRELPGVAPRAQAPPKRPAPAAAPPPPSEPGEAPPPASSPWKIDLARFAVEKWGVRLEDRAVTPKLVHSIEGLGFEATNLSTTPGAKAGVTLRANLNKKGRLRITGTVAPQPLAANLKVNLQAFDILPVQAYFADQGSLTLTQGTVSAQAQIAARTGPGAELQVKLTADADVVDLAAVDNARKEPLMRWTSLHVGGLAFDTSASSIDVDRLALTDFTTRLVLTPEARLNLQDAMTAPGAAPTSPPGKKKASAAPTSPPGKKNAGAAPTSPPDKKKLGTAAAPPAAQSAPPRKPVAAAPEPAPSKMKIKIAQVALQAGRVIFTDRLIRPNYTADLTELSGRIAGLSSTPGSTAGVDIRGSLNRSGVLTMVGKMNPLTKDLFVDLHVALNDFELPPTSTYWGKYIGYTISKGKLAFALDYKIADRKLDAKNKFVLDQLTLGDKVDSPDATHLPVRLAITLLRDRHGVIEIDLPISGALDDPEFKISQAFGKGLGSLIAKVVTSPFALIGLAFGGGGGDELSRVEFAPGLAALDAIGRQRTATLAKALQERPGLTFEIEGGADPKRDRDGLRRDLFESKLKAAKMTELARAGTAVASVNDVEILPAERNHLLAKAYAAEKFSKPKTIIGREKSLPPAEQEKLMLANTRVEDEELRALALRRATNVKSAIAKTAPGGASRLYLVTPRLADGAGRVELRLKKD